MHHGSALVGGQLVRVAATHRGELRGVVGDLAAAYGWEHTQVSDLSAFEAALSGARSAGDEARRIIEVRLR